MFNIGFSELLILGVIGLLVLGPEQLPEVARKLAKILNDLKRAKDEILSPVEDLKAEAQRMLERARESAAQKELDELLQKIDPNSIANNIANYDPLKPKDPAAPIPPEPIQQEMNLDANAVGDLPPSPVQMPEIEDQAPKIVSQPSLNSDVTKKNV